MTKDEILAEQSDCGQIEDIYEVLFDKLYTEYETFCDKLINMSTIPAFDQYSEEYTAVIKIMTLYSDFVAYILDDGMAEFLANQPDLLHKLSVQYNENMQYFSGNSDWYDIWNGVFFDVIEALKSESV